VKQRETELDTHTAPSIQLHPSQDAVCERLKYTSQLIQH